MERWMEKNKDNGEKEKDLSAGYCLANQSKHLNLDQGRLDDAGFTKLEEREAWSKEGKVVQGGKYYYNRNRCNFYLLPIKLVITYQRSTLVAFTVGEKYQPGGEFKVLKRRKRTLIYLNTQVIGAHTDSPVLKVKPVSAKTANGYIQVMSET